MLLNNRHLIRQVSKSLLSTSTSITKSYPAECTIVEVGPRDGLQNEKAQIPTEKKIEFVNKLSETGLKRIEVTSFVSPKWIPQLADAKIVMKGIKRNPDVRYSTLTPNFKGFQAALESKSQEVAIFGAVSETFTKKNVNCTIEQSLKLFDEVLRGAKEHNILVRGYISCVVGCPYEGYIKPSVVAKVTERLFEMGCYEVSLGDTIGVGNPVTMNAMLNEVKKVVGTSSDSLKRLAVHCHDTYNLALVNIVQALEHGITVIDSSCAGLGGCPYASSSRGSATGNVATEDVLYMLDGMGVKTGVDIDKIVECSEYIMNVLNRKTVSRVGQALVGRKEKKKSGGAGTC